MFHNASARELLRERIRSAPPQFYRVVGIPYTAVLETGRDPTKLDHLLIELEIEPYGRLTAALNTFSRLNYNAGFDPGIRVGIVASPWTELPAPTVEPSPGLNYATIEQLTPVSYTLYDSEPLAALLRKKTRAAHRLEVWGEIYARNALGIHQIHSRRASKAVSVDLCNRDGAIKFYFKEGQRSELLLFKFDGQP